MGTTKKFMQNSQKTTTGILGYILRNSYLDKLTFTEISKGRDVEKRKEVQLIISKKQTHNVDEC